MFVTPGDQITGVSAHKFKAGFDYWLTRQWRFGADLIAASSQFFFSDNSNLNAPLGGYAKVNLLGIAAVGTRRLTCQMAGH
ncbi:hypothetical protein [Hyphomicrobium sp.]|uniref:hypothetical protein n=1 Tax=Hyphomicrobium sp. TaxID=82 RepID=UPI002E3808EE|nr:hypothetical protein [Hyphomicrobium sp.]HEX2841349.1 hypothetical protein [Hyphomicrobium sp.]